MTDIITDERLAEIRAGLIGVTPGPWVNDAPGCVGVHYPQGGKATICTSPWERPEDVANAAHIARLDPQTVSALLARLDKAEEALRQIVKYEADMESHSLVASYFATLAKNALPPPPIPKED